MLRPTGAIEPLRRATYGVRAAGRANPGWTATIAATLGLTAVAAGDGVLPGDVATQRAIQDLAIPGGAALAAVVNTVGGTTGSLLVALVAAFWCARRGHGAAALVVLGALALRCANALIKTPVGSPRPPDGLVQVTEQANGYGFPSAHVMGAVVLYGTLLFLAPRVVAAKPLRWAIQAGAVLMLLTIGYGRIEAGAHWPSDVLGAYLYGIIGLAGLLALHRACDEGRLSDPEALARAAVTRIKTAGSACLRFFSPMPTRRPTTQAVPVRVYRTGDRER